MTLRVAIVDAYPLFRVGLRAAISDHGRDLEIAGEADSLETAAALLDGTKPDVVVLDAAGQPKELWVVPGADHGEPWTVAKEEFDQRLVDFYRKVFP